MSKELREQAEKNCILEIVNGSQLYGTSTPESDTDSIGIFMPPIEYILGFKKVEEVDLGTHSKDETGKNTKDAIDRKLYEFRKFLSLAQENNPNILEILFVPKQSILSINDYGSDLLSIKHLFPSKLCMKRFTGYAYSQKHKMVIKADHLNELHDAYEFLELFEPKLTMGQVHDRAIELDPNCKTFWKKDSNIHIHCGDICFEPSVYVKKAEEILKERLDKATNRSESILKHGYCPKFGSHLIRLMYEGLDLLRNGELVFPLPQRQELLDIKQGKWKVEEILKLADELEKEIEAAEKSSKLPTTPYYKDIENFCIGKLYNWLNC